MGNKKHTSRENTDMTTNVDVRTINLCEDEQNRERKHTQIYTRTAVESDFYLQTGVRLSLGDKHTFTLFRYLPRDLFQFREITPETSEEKIQEVLNMFLVHSVSGMMNQARI